MVISMSSFLTGVFSLGLVDRWTMVSEIPEMIMDVVAFVGRGLVRSDALYALQAVLASAAPPGAESADADGDVIITK